MKALLLFAGRNAQKYAENENAASMARILMEMGMQVDTLYSNLGDLHTFIYDVAEYVKTYQSIFVIGGMGNEYKRNTKDILAGGLGLELEVHSASVDKLSMLSREQGRVLNDRDLDFIRVPVDAKVFEHDESIIPGFCAMQGEQMLVMLPDNGEVYVEMFAKQVVPYLNEHLKLSCYTRAYHLIGLKESQARLLLGKLLDSIYPSISLFTRGGVAEIVSIIARNPDEGENRSWIEKSVAVLYHHTSGLISRRSVTNLPSTLVAKLQGASYTVSVAETLTDGLLAGSLLRVDGGEDVVKNHIATLLTSVKIKECGVLPEIVEKHNDSSAEMCISLAYGIGDMSNTDLGLSICGGIAPDKNGEGYHSSAYIGIAAGKKVMARRVDLIGLNVSSKQAVSIYVILALKQLNDVLMGLPQSVTEFEVLNETTTEEIERVAERLRARQEERNHMVKEMLEELAMFQKSMLGTFAYRNSHIRKEVKEQEELTEDARGKIEGSAYLPSEEERLASQEYSGVTLSPEEDPLQVSSNETHQNESVSEEETLQEEAVSSEEEADVQESVSPSFQKKEDLPAAEPEKPQRKTPPVPDFSPTFAFDVSYETAILEKSLKSTGILEGLGEQEENSADLLTHFGDIGKDASAKKVVEEYDAPLVSYGEGEGVEITESQLIQKMTKDEMAPEMAKQTEKMPETPEISEDRQSVVETANGELVSEDKIIRIDDFEPEQQNEMKEETPQERKQREKQLDQERKKIAKAARKNNAVAKSSFQNSFQYRTTKPKGKLFALFIILLVLAVLVGGAFLFMKLMFPEILDTLLYSITGNKGTVQTGFWQTIKMLYYS